MIPARLSPGDTIGIAAPSDPVRPDLEERLAAGMDLLHSLGFKVQLSQHVRSNSLGYAAAPEEKAADLNQLFADPAVRAIICAQGGDILWGFGHNCPNTVMPVGGRVRIDADQQLFTILDPCVH